MSFGFSVGDFLAILSLANDIRKRFATAPDEFRALTDDIKRLGVVLQDIDDLESEQGLNDQQKEELNMISQGCRNVLKELETMLNKYQEVDHERTDIRGRTQRVWKKIKWDQSEVNNYRLRLAANVNSFNLLIGKINSHISFAIKQGVDLLNQQQDDQQRQEILNWLTPINYATQQSDFLSQSQEGTGQWLLDTDEFQEWVNNKKQTLFCPGIPGAGKTVLTSIIVNDLEQRFGNDGSIGVAYLYCNFRRQEEQTPLNLLTNLLKQLLQGQTSLPESIRKLYKHHKQKESHPSLDEISKLLHSVVTDYSRTFILIDALDECPGSDGTRQLFLNEIFSLRSQTETNLFATSRPIHEIEQQFEGNTSLEIRASNKDVLRYLDGHIFKLPSFVQSNLALREEIKAVIIKAVDGMFLLAQLHLESLIGKRSPKAVRNALHKLPSGSEAYDKAYREAMQRIEGQIQDSKELAMQVLSWITCAKRPLTTTELQHALGVEIGSSELDEDNLPEIEDMVAVCAGLVTVDKQSDIIRLVHYTTQEYFERTQKYWFPHAETDITKVSVTYLLFDTFAAGFCPTNKKLQKRLQLNPLYDYTARNWGWHADTASTEVEDLILDFLQSEAKVCSSSQAMLAVKDYPYNANHSQDDDDDDDEFITDLARLSKENHGQYSPNQMTGIHLAAWFGLESIIMALFKNGYDPDPKDIHSHTPLSYAALNGHEAVVKLLLEKGANPDLKDTNGRTPLLYAGQNGHEAVVKLLLEKGANPDLKDTDGRTPLLYAGQNGHEVVVKLLLEKGANPDLKDTGGRTPLSYAGQNGHETVVKLLLERGADPDSKDSANWTPLAFAAANGHDAVVKILLKKGVDPDSKGMYHGATPLWLAAYNGYKAVVKLLLEKGANPESGRFGFTPLSWAAENGHEAVVKLLLEKGVHPDSKSKSTKAPLSLAAQKGHKAAVKLLLENGADPESDGDRSTYTPLLWAAKNGDEAVVKLLLEKGADPDSKGIHYSGTPLLLAAENGHKAVVKLLLEKGADLHFKDGRGQTALSYAALNEHEAVVKLLLEKGADPDSKGSSLDSESERKWTPLSVAAENGDEAVVKLLLEKGADPDSKGMTYHGTPLERAADKGHKAVVKLLLEKGADPDSKGMTYHGTPLLLAAENGHKAVVKLLLEKGADPDSKGMSYRGTPLKRAAEMGHKEVVKLLLEKGADPDLEGIS